MQILNVYSFKSTQIMSGLKFNDVICLFFMYRHTNNQNHN